MSAQLSACSLSISYNGRAVLDGVGVVAGDGERLGLVGENGAGKSTLLRLLAGRENADAGEIARQGSLGYLAQEPELPDGGSIGEAVDRALAVFRRLEARLRHLEARMAASGDVLDEYGEVLGTYEARDGWSADARAAKALAGLGLGHLPLEHPVAALSGGERARLALALVLVEAPDILLLDEPTNHLDDDASAFLEQELRTRRGVLVAASHDRAFLDAVCTSIVDLDPALRLDGDGRPVVGPARYTGAYTAYLEGKSAARARWEQAHASWSAEVAALEAAVRVPARRLGHRNRAPRDNDKFVPHYFGQRVDAAVARRVRDAETRLARLRERHIPRPPAPPLFAPVHATDVPDGVLLSVRDVRVPGRVRVDAVDVTDETRLLVTGPNGAGKTSLLAVLAGALHPERGRVLHARGLRIGWLPQETTFDDPAASALAVFAAGRPGPPEEHQADLVDLGLLPGRDVHTPAGRLSVGQQRRLALARLLTSRPHVLLLDEPTNHLSLALVEELEQAVLGSGVPVVAVSHDRWLRRGWGGETLALRAGRPG